jgi:hypothetical protein
MNFMMKCLWSALLVVPAVGLATPASAQALAPAAALADPSQPGSVIVFPKFVTGTVVVDGVTVPKTEIELGAVCPTGQICPEHQPIKVRFHWVCPGSDNITFKYICNSTDFDVFLTVDGKAVFNPEAIQLVGDLKQASVRKPGFNADGTLCTKGYLIGYVVNLSDQPIKYDGLIGDAVLRVDPAAVQAYRAFTIQADTALATLAPTVLTAEGGLIFDGASGHYKTTTGQISGDVKYDNPGPPTTISTSLSLLTLDVRQGLSNYPTNVHLNFWSEDEVIESTQLHFVCYGTFNLSTKIDPNLTASGMGTRKGVFQSGQAIKTPIAGINDTPGRVTLLALVHTVEGPTSGNVMARTYLVNTYNNGVAVPTTFLPSF